MVGRVANGLNETNWCRPGSFSSYPDHRGSGAGAFGGHTPSLSRNSVGADHWDAAHSGTRLFRDRFRGGLGNRGPRPAWGKARLGGNGGRTGVPAGGAPDRRARPLTSSCRPTGKAISLSRPQAQLKPGAVPVRVVILAAANTSIDVGKSPTNRSILVKLLSPRAHRRTLFQEVEDG